MRTWRLDGAGATLVLAAEDDGLAQIVHFGTPLPEGEDLGALARAHRIDLGGGALDAVAPLSICPEAARTFPGQPGLEVYDEHGAPLTPRFAYAGEEGTDPLTLRYDCADTGIGYAASFATGPHGVWTLSSRVTSRAPVRLRWLAAPVMPAPQEAEWIVDWHGTWLREFHRVATPWQPGLRLREARLGRSGHEHPPFALLPLRGATRTQGAAMALHLAWSGGHRMLAEELPDGRRQIQLGRAAASDPLPGTAFHSAPLLVAWSEDGEAGIARAFQRHLRASAPFVRPARPVHYNCWEAIYFDHTMEALTDIATRAAKLGAERFVLDDGWFGRRDDDTTSLGDWRVDARKYPDGLGPLIEHVHGCGMSFGLWVEPEMVNADSDLFRDHPDWRLGNAGQTPGRGQYVLDLSRGEVRDHLFAALDAILSAHDIDYLKWDHNRLLPVSEAAQCHGLYDLLDRLRSAHPHVEIESCASGGGRIDAGILSRCCRVWLSDSNDAIERLRMQHEAALFLPAAITGSHVGPRESHSSGRVLPMSFRAWVAAQRHMGFEMDPRELTDDEARTLADVTTWWRSNRDWRMSADVLPLDHADTAVTAEIQISADGARFVAFAGRSATSHQSLPRPVRLAGLDPRAAYEVGLANPGDAPPQSRGDVALRDGPLRLSGAALMSSGVSLPWSWPATMYVIEGTRL